MTPSTPDDAPDPKVQQDTTTPAAPQRTPEKDPSDWATGGEPATGPQLSYVSTLAQEAGVDVPENLTKADASKLIDELQEKTGRGGQPTGG
jgi:hypothetical protein